MEREWERCGVGIDGKGRYISEESFAIIMGRKEGRKAVLNRVTFLAWSEYQGYF